MKALLDDPAKLTEMGKEELVELYDLTCEIQDEIEAQKSAISDLLFKEIKGDGEVVGDYTVSKVTRRYFKAGLEQAKELGATKESVDRTALRRLFEKGVEIEHSISKYVRIKKIQKEE